jgi:hypothetical protein
LPRRPLDCSIRRAFVITALAAVSLAAGCGGGGNGAAQTEGTTATTTTATTAPTSTEPAVEPLTDDERGWVTQIRRIRPAIDKQFHHARNLTRATMQSLIRVLHSCKTTLRKAGPASERFNPAARIAQQACARYGTSARQIQRAIDVSGVGGETYTATAADVEKRALDRAFAAYSKATDLILRAEEKADEIRAQIEVEAGS